MGILRTDKISGLETPTAVTGSVYFDGDARNDNLNMSADYGDLDFQNTDFTFESWVYPTDMSVDRYWCSKGNGNLPGTAMDVRFDSDGQIRINFYVSSTAYSLHTSSGVLQENVWSHVAVVRNGTSFKSYVNGKETSSATHNITVSDVSATFIIGILQGVGTGFKGYMSNFRFVRGKAVYIGEFTPPIYALEPIDGTVLLCCNNPDSVTAVSLATVGTSKAITANGDVSIASTSPGLTRDFTSGTEFNGVTTFDTQGYFVPPSGTTAQRGRGRGLIGSGYVAPSRVNTIDYITIQSEGNAQDFGDLTVSRSDCANISSSTRGIFAGGIIGYSDVIDFVTIATTSNAVDFGDISAANQQMAGVSNSTRGLIGGGKTPASNPAGVNTIDYITIPTLGDAQDFGDLLAPQAGHFGTGSATRGIFAGGYTPADTNIIQYVTIASLGDALDFGDLTLARGGGAGGGNSIRGLFYAGYSAPVLRITIDYITIASTGNAQDFGDASSIRGEISGCCSIPTRGVFSGGNPNTNTIEYVTIASTGDAKDFGDLTQARRGTSSLSDSHGGIS